MMRRLRHTVLIAVIASAGCSAILERYLSEAVNGGDQIMNEESIGVATMRADGTIVLQLRAETDDGAIGDGYFTYAPTDKDYDSVLEHLGGLKPGESKPVPPWPDN